MSKQTMFLAILMVLFSGATFSEYIDCDSKTMKYEVMNCEQNNMEDTEKRLKEIQKKIKDSSSIKSADKYALERGDNIWLKAITDYCNSIDTLSFDPNYGKDHTDLTCKENLIRNHIVWLEEMKSSLEKAMSK